MNIRPIYIAGLERSGTSLIYALLGSHPAIAMTRRTNLWTHFYEQYGDLSRPENFERCLAMMLRYKRIVRLKPDPDRLRREFGQGEATYARLFALLGEHYAESQQKPRWGDKSLNTERYAEPIFAAYPQARMIHMIRDPRDRYASAITRWGRSRGGVGAGTAMWLWSVNCARRHQERFPGKYKIVRYETLVFRPEETLREICEFIGEEYSPRMLSMQSAQSFRDEGGNSSYGRRPPGYISTNSIGRFRSVLSRRQIAYMERTAGREMASYGYVLDKIEMSAGEKIAYYLIESPVNVSRAVAWRAREALLDRKGRAVPSYRIIPEPEVATART
jgi:hypothetical protein